MKKILFILISFLSATTMAQVGNDVCASAIDLGTLPTPAACPGGAGTLFTYNGTTTNAIAENPFSALSCADIPAADVWVSFEASGNDMDLDFTSGLNDANISIYTGDCANLVGIFCEASNNGNISATLSPFTPGETYYMQISGRDENDFSNFTLEMTNFLNCDLCAQDGTITATPAPVNNAYLPGQTVQFCVQVEDYVQVSANWMHGMIPSFGAGWDLSTLTPISASGTSNGKAWVWTTWNGDTGYFADVDPAGPTGPDGVPNNYGMSSAAPFEWCFEITVDAACSPGASLDVSANTTADGETGSWTSVACQDDPDIGFSAIMVCCELPLIASVDESCPGASDGSATVEGQGGLAPYDYDWENSAGGNVHTETTAGVSSVTGLPADTYTVTVTDATGCEMITDVTVGVGACPPCFISSFSSTTGACQPDNTFDVTGSFTYENNPGGADVTVYVTNGSGTQTHVFTPPFVNGQVYNYSVTGNVSDGTATTIEVYFDAEPACIATINGTSPADCQCVADAGTHTASVTGDATITGSDIVLCFGDQVTLTSGMDYTYPNEASNPPGPVYDPNLAYIVYECPPTVFPQNEIWDNMGNPLDPCVLGVVGYGDVFNSTNTIGQPPYVGTFTDNTLYYLPVTVYSEAGGTLSWTNTSEACWDFSDLFSVQYLPEVTSAIVEDCETGTATVTISGGAPEVEGTLFTASNLLPVTASFDNTTALHDGDIVISGLATGDAYSFDVVGSNGCPITISGTMSTDPFPPTASNPAPINVQCSGDVPAPDVLVVTTENDNQGPPVVAWVSDVSNNGTCPEIITRTYSVTDLCANQILVTQTITVDDTVDPVATGPVDASYQCIGDVPAQVLGDVTGVSDNCTAAPVVAMNAEVQAGTCPLIITREYTVTDDCGNQLLLTQTITVDDTVDPVATGPVDASYQCIGDVPVQAIGDVTGVSDNCTAAPVVAMNAEVQVGTCPMTITREYTVTDDCGNQLLLTQTITVDDTVDPVGTGPVDASYQCIGDVPVQAISDVTGVSDNCTAAPVVAMNAEVQAGTCPMTITREYTVTDDCGNQILLTQTITVDDTIDPTATDPLPQTGTPPAFDATQVTDEADNCGIPTVTHGGDVSDMGSCPEIITREYVVTDGCGNSISVFQTFTIGDAIIPTASDPLPMTEQCIGDVDAPDVTVVTDEADNGATPTVTWESDVSNMATCPEIITRTYRVTDDCGNFIFVEQTITVNDDIDPVATGPVDASYQCIGDVPAQAISDVTGVSDNCTAAPVVAMNAEVQAGTCPIIITREFTVTDDCGNQILLTQTITVDDTVDPVATGPVDASYQCVGDVPAQAISDVTGVSDNCTAAPVVAMNAEVQAGTCPLIITREYTVTDDCGNQILLTQTITVDDTVDPVATGPVDASYQCIGDVPAQAIGDVTGVSDNCTAAPVVAMNAEVQAGTCPMTITREYTVTDDCGNQILLTQTITVDDTIDPTATDPTTTTVPGGPAPAVDINVVTDEADNCGVPTVAFVSESTDGGGCPETITRIYSVTDDCGNTINVTHTILITDPFPPTASDPLPMTEQCIGDVDAPDVTVVTDEADNQGAPVVAWVSDVSNNQTCPEIITRTYSVTDLCGGQIFVEQTITVNDDIDPVATGPVDASYQCIGDVPAQAISDVTGVSDNCTAAPVVAMNAEVQAGTCPLIITREYTVTDDCGNQILLTQTITVDDTVDPVATGPVDASYQCIGDVPAQAISDVTGVSDNCTAAPVVAMNAEVQAGTCPLIITREYTVTDDCGNQILLTQTITVDDTVDPVATGPVDASYQCIGDVPVQAISDVTGVSDNCTAAPVVAMNAEVQAGTCPLIITREYTVTDDCGNQILLTQTITVDDTIDPTATDPTTTTVPGGPAPAVDINVVTDEADNCGVPTVAFVSESTDGGGCPETITRIYSVTDDCGNTINVTHTILITDPFPPTASDPLPMTEQCIGDVDAPDVTVVTDEADNQGAPVVAWVSDVSNNQTCPEIITRTYSVTDLCGGQIFVEQTITVNDDIDPVATGPVDASYQCIGDVPAQAIGDVTGVSDNCTAAPVVAMNAEVQAGTCPLIITREYTVTDDCGNQILLTQTITVDDTVDPVATGPVDASYQCIGDVPAQAISDVTGVSDNCTAAPVVAMNAEVQAGTCPLIITREYTVTDDCGNQILLTQTITVDDTVDPVATGPVDASYQCIGDVPVQAISDVTGVSDNCTAAPVVAMNAEVQAGTCPIVITREYTVTDDCGNQILLTQTITVNDDIDPVGTAPVAASYQCIGDVPAQLISDVTGVSDNCTAVPTVAIVSETQVGTCPIVITREYSVTDDCGNQIILTQTITVDDTVDPVGTAPVAASYQCIGDVPAQLTSDVTGVSDNCTVAPVVAIVSETQVGTCPIVITREYSVTDDCNNQIILTQTITVDDTVDPVGTAPVAASYQCIGDVPAQLTSDVTGVSDNCTAVPTVAIVSETQVGTCPIVITREYSVTDDCNNQIILTQTITVNDTQDPLGTAPADAAYQCIGDVPAQLTSDVTGVSDNCTAVPTVAIVSETQVGACPIVITREYSVTDDCGNQIILTQTITVNDTEAPTASNLPQVNVECIGDVLPGNILDVTDEADNCTANPTVVLVGDVSDGLSCPETITRTYSVTDDCGNQILVTQTIVVNDVTAPTASNLLPISVPGPLDVPAPDPSLVTDAADNCTLNPVVAFVSDVSDGNVCNLEEITRTYSITDDCGNQTLVTQTIVILAVPAPISAEDHLICIGDQVTLVADNPWNVPISWSGGVVDSQPFSPTNTATYTVTADNLGCISSTTATVTVEELPIVNFSVSDPGCEPFTVTFTNQSTAGSAMVNCVWDIDGAAPITQCGDLTYTLPAAGVYGAGLTITSENGCVSSVYYPDLINVIPMPIASFTASSTDLTTLNGNVDFTNTSEFADSYSWNFGDGSPIVFEQDPSHTFPTEEDGGYTVELVAYNSIGCTDTAIMAIRVEEELIFYVPNTFTPDQDAFNNTFQPVFTSGFDPFDFDMFIFNRWGELIFESHDASVGWDGTYAGKLMQDGTYTWKIEFKQTKNDKRHMKTGHVNIIR